MLLKQWDNWRDWSHTGAKVTCKCSRTWKAIHTAPIQCMSFDATSTLLATGSSDFTTKIWDIQAQYCTHNLRGAQGIVRCVQFHPLIEQKQTCVTGSEDGKVRVYNLNTSRMEACLEGHFSAITCLEYINYADELGAYEHLLSAARDKVIIIWDLKTLAKCRTIPVYESLESVLMLNRLVSAGDDEDRFLITMGNEGLLKLWDLKQSKCLLTQCDEDSPKMVNKRSAKTLDPNMQQCIVQSVFVKSQSTLVLVTIDQLIVFVKLSGERLVEFVNNPATPTKDIFHVCKQFIGDHGEILDAQLFNSNENLLALATNSEFIKIYDLNTWNCKMLKGHQDLVICLSVFEGKLSSESAAHVDYFASSSKDSTIRLWRVSRAADEEELTYECLATGVGHTQDVGALAFSRCGLEFLVSGSIDTTIKLWRLVSRDGQVSMSVAFTMKAHEKDINSVCVSPNDKLIASGSSDKTAKLWSAVDGACLAVLRGHKRGVWCVQFSTVDQVTLNLIRFF